MDEIMERCKGLFVFVFLVFYVLVVIALLSDPGTLGQGARDVMGAMIVE